MQFQIPQFIEIEDKIAGPFSLRQLLFVVGGSVIAFIAFTTLPFIAALLIGVLSLGGALALALIKVNGQPLTRVAFAAAGFFWKPRLYLWKREVKQRVIEVPEFAGLKNAPQATPAPIRVAIPAPAIIPEAQIIEQRDTLKKFTAQMPSINKLSGDLNTSKNPIPKREKTVPMAVKEKFSIIRRSTGDRQAVKRVDFR